MYNWRCESEQKFQEADPKRVNDRLPKIFIRCNEFEISPSNPLCRIDRIDDREAFKRNGQSINWHIAKDNHKDNPRYYHHLQW